MLDGYAAHREGKCKDSSIKLELTTVRTLLNFLRDEKLLSADSHFRYKTKKPKKTMRRYCPCDEEACAILQELQGDPKLQWLIHATTMLLNTGLRFSEIAQMTSHDVDLKRGVIWVLDEDENEESGKKTKSGESRFLPITAELRPVLEKLITADDRRLFLGPRGGLLRSDTFNDALRSKALKPLEDLFPHARFQSITAHSLRHFFQNPCDSQRHLADRDRRLDGPRWKFHGTALLSCRYRFSVREYQKI